MSDGWEHQASAQGTKRSRAKRACLNCKKSKTACDDTRPCTRCVGAGLAESCIDVERKRSKRKKEPARSSSSLSYPDIRTPSSAGSDTVINDISNGILELAGQEAYLLKLQFLKENTTLHQCNLVRLRLMERLIRTPYEVSGICSWCGRSHASLSVTPTPSLWIFCLAEGQSPRIQHVDQPQNLSEIVSRFDDCECECDKCQQSEDEAVKKHNAPEHCDKLFPNIASETVFTYLCSLAKLHTVFAKILVDRRFAFPDRHCFSCQAPRFLENSVKIEYINKPLKDEKTKIVSTYACTVVATDAESALEVAGKSMNPLEDSVSSENSAKIISMSY